MRMPWRKKEEKNTWIHVTGSVVYDLEFKMTILNSSDKHAYQNQERCKNLNKLYVFHFMKYTWQHNGHDILYFAWNLNI